MCWGGGGGGGGGGSTVIIRCKGGDFCDFRRQNVVKYTFWVLEMLGC